MTTVKAAVSEYMVAHKSHAVTTQKNNKHMLGMFALWCEQEGVTLETLRASHIRAFLAYVGNRPGQHGDTLKDSSVRQYGKSIKSLVVWCSGETDEYTISASVAARVKLPTVEQPVIEVFTAEEIRDLFAAVEKMPYPIRDRAILSVLLDSGVRASELCGLLIADIGLDADDSYLLIRHTKSKRDREVPVGRATRLALKKYIRSRKPASKNETHLFLSNHGRGLTRGGLFQIVSEWGQRAGVEDCHPHRFRHFFACSFLLNGGDVAKLSKLLGHGSIRITADVYLSAVTSRQARQGGESVLDRLKKDL